MPSYTKNATGSKRKHHSDILLETKNLSVVRNRKTLLEDVSICLRRNEIVTLLGPNGAGKTTLLQALLGLFPSKGGSVYRAKNVQIGYVPQKLSPSHLMPLSLRRFVTLCSNAAHESIDKRLESLGINDLATQQLYNLSGGELQKAMLARATAKEPECLILDEPLSGVDEAGQKKIYAWIEKYSRENSCAILMASHDLHLVMGATDRVICLDKRIRCEGKPKAVMQTQEFNKLFGKIFSNNRYAIYAHEHNEKKNEK